MSSSIKFQQQLTDAQLSAINSGLEKWAAPKTLLVQSNYTAHGSNSDFEWNVNSVRTGEYAFADSIYHDDFSYRFRMGSFNDIENPSSYISFQCDGKAEIYVAAQISAFESAQQQGYRYLTLFADGLVIQREKVNYNPYKEREIPIHFSYNGGITGQGTKLYISPFDNQIDIYGVWVNTFNG